MQAPDKRACLAADCDEELDRHGSYCVSRRLCPVHLKAGALRRAGDASDCLWRFCQQCGKLELLESFDGAKRSCRVALARRRNLPSTVARSGAGGRARSTTMRTSVSCSMLDAERLQQEQELEHLQRWRQVQALEQRTAMLQHQLALLQQAQAAAGAFAAPAQLPGAAAAATTTQPAAAHMLGAWATPAPGLWGAPAPLSSAGWPLAECATPPPAGGAVMMAGAASPFSLPSPAPAGAAAAVAAAAPSAVQAPGAALAPGHSLQPSASLDDSLEDLLEIALLEAGAEALGSSRAAHAMSAPLPQPPAGAAAGASLMILD